MPGKEKDQQYTAEERLIIDIFGESQETHEHIKEWRRLSIERTPVSYTEKSLRFEVEQIMSSLGHEENTVLLMLFGLEDGNAKTPEQVGVSIGKSTKEVLEIEKKALFKLRSPQNVEKLQHRL